MKQFIITFVAAWMAMVAFQEYADYKQTQLNTSFCLSIDGFG